MLALSRRVVSRCEQNERNERGSVAVVVLVLFVLASLATLMVIRDIDEARSSREIQHRAAHVAATDVAVAEVITALVDQRSPVAGLRGTAGEVEWTVRATADGPDRWNLDVETVLPDGSRAVEVTLVDHPVDGWTTERWIERRGSS